VEAEPEPERERVEELLQVLTQQHPDQVLLDSVSNSILLLLLLLLLAVVVVFNYKSEVFE
jgi:hypothetical protein